MQERNARRSEVKLVKSAEKKKKDKLPTFPITAINYTWTLLQSRCILRTTCNFEKRCLRNHPGSLEAQNNENKVGKTVRKTTGMTTG